ncbi:MAG: glycosyltransferase [Halieaceae bacterium]|nr:glycosyltransferase [Halieaceae bacterium]
MISQQVGAVAIGRNEGARLRACLESLLAMVDRVVYVDSGSSDDSVAVAESLGVTVVHLDPDEGFTAGKARNLGARALLDAKTPPAFIQFVDGDCVLVSGWLEQALRRLGEDSGLAVVAGWRRERFPQATIFNRQCDMEWNTPIGEAAAVGGDALYRSAAFASVGGFDPAFICGEEPELCYRLRQAHWRIERLDVDMTLHDAAISRWSQWWKRVVRTGWAFAEGAATYGATQEAYNRREALRIALWGVAYPLAVLLLLLLALVLGEAAPLLLALALLALLPLMTARIALYRGQAFDDPLPHGLLYGALVMLGKVPEAVGAWRYLRSRARSETARIIEYK